MNTHKNLIIELSSSKIGYAIYAANGQILDDKILGARDPGKLPLSTKAAVQGDLETQDTIIDKITAVREAAERQGIDSYRIIATSAFRDDEHASREGSAFANRILNATGLEVDILTGTEEAQYIASAILNDPAISTTRGQPSLLIDMGGRSTEFIATNENNTIIKIKSYPFGRLSPPLSTQNKITDALNDFTSDIEHPERIIYSGSLYRKSVGEFNKSATNNHHSLFSAFMKSNTENETLASAIKFPNESVHIADQLAQEIEEKIQPYTAMTSTAKVPQGSVILHPERLKPIPDSTLPTPSYGL